MSEPLDSWNDSAVKALVGLMRDLASNLEKASSIAFEMAEVIEARQLPSTTHTYVWMEPDDPAAVDLP